MTPPHTHTHSTLLQVTALGCRSGKIFFCLPKCQNVSVLWWPPGYSYLQMRLSCWTFPDTNVLTVTLPEISTSSSWLYYLERKWCQSLKNKFYLNPEKIRENFQKSNNQQNSQKKKRGKCCSIIISTKGQWTGECTLSKENMNPKPLQVPICGLRFRQCDKKALVTLHLT